MPVIEGTRGTPLQVTGAPVAGTDEVQTLTIDATGGTFKLAFQGFTTAAIAWSATSNTLVANVDAALELLPSIGTGGVTTAIGTMTSGVGTLTLTFAGTNTAKKAQPLVTVANNSLTGTATLSIAETTPGVDASSRGAAVGAFLVRDNGTVYVNTGTAQAPTWTAVGSQS